MDCGKDSTHELKKWSNVTRTSIVDVGATPVNSAVHICSPKAGASLGVKHEQVVMTRLLRVFSRADWHQFNDMVVAARMASISSQ